MTTATMDDGVFREFRQFGFSEETAAKMAALLADREAECVADHESANGATAREVADREADGAAFATEREARIYRTMYDDISFRELVRDAVAFFKVGGAEVKKMVTGKPWNGWVVYQFVMFSLLAVLAPTAVGTVIYLWFVV